MMGGIMLSLKNEIVKIAPLGRVNCISPGKSVLIRFGASQNLTIEAHRKGWTATAMAQQALQNQDIVYAALAS
jgi:hypothetical protein